jgi:hypothetical protein
MGEAKRKRQAGAGGRYEELAALFARHGIDTTAPGFFDLPAFLAAEKRSPSFLNNYGEFVARRPYTDTETARAREIVPIVTELVCTEVEDTGRLGMCVNASQLLQRSLDRLGVWNYSVIGAVAASVAVRGGRIERHFWVVDDKDTPDSQVGHVWNIAPTFPLVDATFALQGWPNEIRAAAPRFVVLDSVTPAVATADDMVAPHYQAEYQRYMRRPIPPKHFNGTERDYIAFAKRFPGFAAEIGDITARYFPTGVRAPDTPIEEMFAGEAAAFWNRRIVPAFGVAPISR